MGANPFFRAFSQSDFFGSAIFIALYALSIASWATILRQALALRQERRQQQKFWKNFQANCERPLSLEIPTGAERLSPLCEIYRALRRQTLTLLKKNRPLDRQDIEAAPAHLTQGDLDLIASQMDCSMRGASEHRRRSLYLLSLCTTLAPFLGLLGTVWGILLSFGALQTGGANPSGEGVLSGLSLALATTVLGLLVAIPALIGYNLLKFLNSKAETELDEYAHHLLASIEVHYRKLG